MKFFRTKNNVDINFSSFFTLTHNICVCATLSHLFYNYVNLFICYLIDIQQNNFFIEFYFVAPIHFINFLQWIPDKIL